MNLDDELRALFADARLDMPVRPGAEQALVAGARRVRRRRVALTAAAGAMTVAGLVGSGVALASIGGPQSQPPATRAPISTTTSTTNPTPPSTASGTTPPAAETSTTRNSSSSRAPTTPAPDAGLIGPNGYGKLTLGMSFEQAKSTGVVQGDPPPAPTDPADSTACVQYPMSTGGIVWITAAGGVESIQPTQRLRTPQGVSTGWTIAQVNAIHPEVTQDSLWNGSRDIPVPGNVSASYRFTFTDGKLTGITLQHTRHYCYN